MDAGGRATQGAIADDGMDAGGRAMQGAIAEDEGEFIGFLWFPSPLLSPIGRGGLRSKHLEELI